MSKGPWMVALDDPETGNIRMVALPCFEAWAIFRDQIMGDHPDPDPVPQSGDRMIYTVGFNSPFGVFNVNGKQQLALDGRDNLNPTITKRRAA